MNGEQSTLRVYRNTVDSDRSISPLESIHIRRARDRPTDQGREERRPKVRMRKGDYWRKRASGSPSSEGEEDGRKRVKLDEDVGIGKGGDDVG